MKKDQIFQPRNSLIVVNYNFENISNRLTTLIELCCGDSWDEIANKISKFASWEFEGYRE